jgi:hypothetical protein
MPEYQEAKRIIVSILELSKDSIHMHVGLIVFFLAVVLWKKGSIETRCLIPVVIVASLMEILDLRYDYVSLGHFRLNAITASIHDLINTTFWPVVIVALAWLGKLQNARKA